MQEDLPPVAQRIIAEIQQHPKVVAIFLFGSWARGEQMPISDVDIAVLLDNPDRRDEADVGSMYSPAVDVVLFHRLPLRIQFQVIKEGRLLFVRDEEKAHRDGLSGNAPVSRGGVDVPPLLRGDSAMRQEAKNR